MRGLIVLMALLLASRAECRDSDRLVPISYSGPTSVTSEMKAEVEFVAGQVKGYRLDELILPQSISKTSWEARHPHPMDTFDADDEQSFAESLMSELTRLHLFKQAVMTGADRGKDAVHIRLCFVRTVFLPGGQYILYVVMRIEAGPCPVVKGYIAESKPRMPLLKALRARAVHGQWKASAAQRLLDQLIPDIESFLRADASP